MTGKERSVLETVREEVSEIRQDIKRLAEFMATYTERSRGCDEKFRDLGDKTRKLERWKWTISGGLTLLGFALGLAVKLL